MTTIIHNPKLFAVLVHHTSYGDITVLVHTDLFKVGKGDDCDYSLDNLGEDETQLVLQWIHDRWVLNISKLEQSVVEVSISNVQVGVTKVKIHHKRNNERNRFTFYRDFDNYQQAMFKNKTKLEQKKRELCKLQGEYQKMMNNYAHLKNLFLKAFHLTAADDDAGKGWKMCQSLSGNSGGRHFRCCHNCTLCDVRNFSSLEASISLTEALAESAKCGRCSFSRCNTI